ncbi:MAG: serine/threonine protein kinase [Lentisphaeria bacterium]|nr:serine/threonine protein kinase [Lentisphaeria bacterium]
MSIDKTIATGNKIEPVFKTLSDSMLNSPFTTILSETSRVRGDNTPLPIEEMHTMTNIETHYNLMDEFNSGGQGTIHTGQDYLLKRYVAIKSLRKELLENDDVVANFVREARITAQLDHPCIIPLYNMHKDDDDGLHISMKLIHGKTLEKIIEDDRLNARRKDWTWKKEQAALNKRLGYFIKVCEALSFSHEKDVIHRDLKPENIMVGNHGEVYVMDWGIAQTIPEGEKFYEGDICGTPCYIAPEVALDARYTKQADQYAMGIILYELVCLNGANEATSVKQALLNTVQGDLNPVEHVILNHPIPADLKAIILKAISLDPEERYESIDALSRDIKNYMSMDEVKARPDNFFSSISRWVVKNRGLATLLMMSFAILFMLAVIVGLYRNNQYIEKTKKDSIALLNLSARVEVTAAQIDQHFDLLGTIVERYADHVELQLRPSHSPKGLGYADYTEFAKTRDLPSGTFLSPSYGQYVSAEMGNYKIPKGAKLSDYSEKLSRTYNMPQDLQHYIRKSGTEEQRARNTNILKETYPIRWIYSGFEDGLLLSYPGTGVIDADYDPRKRVWYQDGLQYRGIKWSLPYVDLFGQGIVVSATKAIRGKGDKPQGVSAIDIQIDHVIKWIQNRAAKNWFIKGRYLVNNEGKVVISDQIDYSSVMSDDDLKVIPFPYHNSLKNQSGKSGRFESEDGSLIIAYSPVHSLNWYYVEVVDKESYLD